MAFGFNQIGEYLAGRDHPDGIVPLSLLGEGHAFLKEGIFVPLPDGASARFDAHGLERFVARRLANKWTQPVSNACRLGEVCGRALYYISKPDESFFSMHRGKVSVIIGSNDAKTPMEWDGFAVMLSEIFYFDKAGKICVAQDVCRRLLPPSKGQVKAAASTPQRHERRAEWLQFLLECLAPLYKDPKAKVVRPTFQEAMVYFRKKFPSMPTSERTYRRDIADMTGSKTSASKFDKRDELMTRIWNHFEDPVYIREAKVIEQIVEALCKIRADRGEGASVGAMPSVAWQKVRGEDRCERTAYVQPALDCDDDRESLIVASG